MRIALLLLCSLIYAAPAFAQGNTRDWEKPGPAAERQMYYARVRHDVHQMLMRWKDAWERDDAKALGNFYATDASYMAPADAVQTRKSITEYFNTFLKTAGGLDFQPAGFGTSGELAYMSGKLLYLDQTSGRQIVRTDMFILRKNTRGDWLIESHLARLEPEPRSNP